MKTCLRWREIRRFTAKNSQLDLKNKYYLIIRLLTKKIETSTSYVTAYRVSAPPPPVQRRRAVLLHNKSCQKESWCDPRRCRCIPDDPDDDDAATPEIILAQSQAEMMFSDFRIDVPAAAYEGSMVMGQSQKTVSPGNPTR